VSAKLHQEVSNIRNYAIHKATTSITKNYFIVAI
jgi:hypothetical protein